MENLKNNLIFAPVKLGYAFSKDGKVSEKHFNFYKARSKYVGAVTYEPLYIHKGLRELPTQLGIDDDDKIEGLKKLNDEVKRYGAKTIAHLNHPGRLANPKIPGNFWVSSTNQACENGGATPNQMNKNDINEAIDLVVDAAIRAEKSDFDIIELQLGHGYLSAQFLSALVNDRNDEYGGPLENRVRFSLELFEAVKNAVNIPVQVRITATETIEGGINLDEAKYLAGQLKTLGAEVFHIVAGSGCSTPPWFFQHMFIPKGKLWDFAKEIRESVNVKVITVGRVTSTENVDFILNSLKSDFVAVGRALIADPDFIGKYLGEVEGNIRPCLSCAEGCLGGVKSGNGLGCMVNPLIGREELKIKKSEKPKKIAVVGGGLSGMEAAIRAKDRGHNVTIYERDKLGGQFNLAWLPPKKGSLKELVDFYKLEIADKNINVKFQEADKYEIVNNKYNEIILATGAKPKSPPIKGLTHFFWSEFLDDNNLPENKRILIIGGGLIGIEIASKLVDNNNKVIIVEMMDEVARGMEMIEKKLTLAKLQQFGVNIYTNYRVSEVKNNNSTVVIEGELDKELNNIDHIVVTAGMKSDNSLENDIKGMIEYRKIGDALNPSKAQNAIYDGFEAGIEI